MTEIQKITRIPFIEKAAFGSGHLVNNLFPGSLGVFSFFLLTTFGMDPFLAGLLWVISQIIQIPSGVGEDRIFSLVQ